MHGRILRDGSYSPTEPKPLHSGSPLECARAECADGDGWAPRPLAEYGGSADQAEELEADRILETTHLDEELENLHRQLEIERAALERAERLLEDCERESRLLRAELADLKAGRRETYSRVGW